MLLCSPGKLYSLFMVLVSHSGQRKIIDPDQSIPSLCLCRCCLLKYPNFPNKIWHTCIQTDTDCVSTDMMFSSLIQACVGVHQGPSVKICSPSHLFTSRKSPRFCEDSSVSLIQWFDASRTNQFYLSTESSGGLETHLLAPNKRTLNSSNNNKRFCIKNTVKKMTRKNQFMVGQSSLMGDGSDSQSQLLAFSQHQEVS